MPPLTKKKTIAREIREDAVEVSRMAWQAARHHRALLLSLAAFVLFFSLQLFPFDRVISAAVSGQRTTALRNLASALRRWGDFRDTILICSSLYLAGLAFRRRRWRTLAVTAFLAASLAGITTNTIRFSTGRPRPKARRADAATGPSFQHKYQSFPSGHSTTSTAAGVTLALANPWIGVPALLSAGGIIWSSLYTRNHYVSDVLVGGTIGFLYGFPYGLAVRRRMRTPGEPDRGGRQKKRSETAAKE